MRPNNRIESDEKIRRGADAARLLVLARTSCVDSNKNCKIINNIKINIDTTRLKVYTMKYKLLSTEANVKATAKDLRFHSKELLDTVNRGEEVVITFRGKPCAKLVPFQEVKQHTKGDKTELFGIWKDNSEIENVDEYVRNLRKGRF